VENLLDLRVGHDGRERREVGKGERVDDRGAAFGVGDLEQADLLEVVEEAVRLGVERERSGSGD
jgi:hypothetical protein